MGLEQLAELVDQLEGTVSNEERQRLFKQVSPLVQLQRDSLERVLEICKREGSGELVRHFSADSVLGPLLRGYELVEPERSLEERVEAALELARPPLLGHGGNVRLLKVAGNVAHLELTGSCNGCASSLITLKRGIEETLYEQVPELRGVEVAGLTSAKAAEPKPKWVPLVAWNQLQNGSWLRIDAFDQELLVFTVDNKPFVLLNRCPAGEAPLQESKLQALELVCGCHGHRFDLRSGRCSDVPGLSLKVYPSTVESSIVQVAL